ncbi:hypothetical protein ACFWJM_05870 [Streptomyces sp. NPDC127077]|uniref:hypothetical protein n=1 Tax=Streptomyces sp. NPDC127077 TaxID=3347131 RepID=UPI00365FD604
MHYDVEGIAQWDGHIGRAIRPSDEVAQRDELANATRDGNWQRVFAVLSPRDKRSWVNTVRPGGKKRYAPLHQAAWHGVPTDIAQRLLEYGAWRTLRNSAGERPVDVAARRGHHHLAQVLEPEVKHHVPGDVLAELQRNLFALVTRYDKSASRDLCLPDLEVLTELDPPAYWIRISGGIFVIALRGCELNVEAKGKMDYGSSPVFRITADCVYEPSGEPWTVPTPVAVTMADLFDPEPERWGLRGDPYLWRALRAHLSDADVLTSVDEVVSRLRAAFSELVGLDLAGDRQPSVYRAEYAHGGMSSGMISLDTWRERLMPLLAERASNLLQA